MPHTLSSFRFDRHLLEMDLEAVRWIIKENSVTKLKELIALSKDDGKHILTSTNYSIARGGLDSTVNDRDLPSTSLGILHVAAFYDSLEVFLYCFNRGLSLEMRSGAEFKPIHYAALGNATEVATFLCSQGLTTLDEAVGPHELDAISIAAASKAPDVVRVLLENGVPVRNRGGAYSSIGYAIQHRDSATLALLLEYAGETQSNKCLTQGYSPLMRAVACRIPEAVDLLLSRGADPNHMTQEGKCALSLACGGGLADCVKKLIEAGVDMNVLDNQRKGPVFWAAASSNVKILKMVIKAGADPFLIDGEGNNALFSVCSSEPSEWYDMFKILLPLGLDVNRHGHQNKNLLAQTVVRSDVKPDVVRLLIEYGADLSVRLPNRKTVLETAEMCASKEVKAAIHEALAAREKLE